MGYESRVKQFRPSNSGGLAPQTVRDATGRVLEQGDLVVLRTLAEQLWEVAEIKPDLRPGVPANVMLIKLVAVAAFNAPANLPQAEFLRVVSAEERRIAQDEAQAETRPDLEIIKPTEDEAPSGDEGVPV